MIIFTHNPTIRSVTIISPTGASPPFTFSLWFHPAQSLIVTPCVCGMWVRLIVRSEWIVLLARQIYNCTLMKFAHAYRVSHAPRARASTAMWLRVKRTRRGVCFCVALSARFLLSSRARCGHHSHTHTVGGHKSVRDFHAYLIFLSVSFQTPSYLQIFVDFTT